MYSTYFGGAGDYASGTGIAADADGNAYVVGSVTGQQLPLVNAAQTSGPGFAAKFDPSGSRLLYSTYLGAVPRAIAVDRFGAAYIAGSADSRLQAVRPIQPCHDRFTTDAFVIKLNASGSSYDYATCLGGSREESANGIAVDASGSAYITGATWSLDFMTARPLDAGGQTAALLKTDDGGHTWRTLPLDAYSVSNLASSAASPAR